LLRTLLVVGLVLGVGASPALAQGTVAGQVLFGRSSWENGYLSLFHLNRMPTGARSMGMGLTGLAIQGGPSYQQQNAVAAMGVLSPTLIAESKFISGSVNPQSPPANLILPAGPLEASNYRVSYKFDYDYDDMSFAMPITLFGNRGALAAAYYRSSRTGRETETRVELKGSITQQADATYGIGDVPDQGMDRFTLGVAREITSFWDLGANFNWYSGELKRNATRGVSIFGTQLTGGGSAYQQDVSGFNVDLGTQLRFGNLDLGGSLFLGHDLDFKSGKANVQPLPDPGSQEPAVTFGFVPVDMTLNVPAMVGAGGAYHLGERMLFTADYWYRPWSKANITRGALDVNIGFTDLEDPATYFYQLVPVENQTETFSAGLENTDSFGIGFEFLAVHKPGLDVPLRIGFNKGKSTQINAQIPNYLWDQYDSPDSAGYHLDGYLDLVAAYNLQLQNAPDDSLTHAMANTLRQIDEYNLALFRGDAPDVNTLTLGAGVKIHNFTADLGLAFHSFTWTRFYLQDFDPVLNPIPAIVTEKRNVTDIVVSIGMGF